MVSVSIRPARASDQAAILPLAERLAAGHVAILAVAQEAEGQGVGRALLRAAETLAEIIPLEPPAPSPPCCRPRHRPPRRIRSVASARANGCRVGRWPRLAVRTPARLDLRPRPLPPHRLELSTGRGG